MIEAIKLAKFAEKNGWLVISKDNEHIRFLTPQGAIVFVVFYEDGSIQRITS